MRRAVRSWPRTSSPFAREHLAPYKRVRRIEFVSELPKTISGKIRRVELRQMEVVRRQGQTRGEHEHFEEDFLEGKTWCCGRLPVVPDAPDD